MKIYLSGKITDLPSDKVREKFAQAADQIRALSHDPVSPLDNGVDYDAAWNDHIVADIATLLRCDAIYLLKDWQESKGSRIEHLIAKECGKEIYLQPDLADLNIKHFPVNRLPYFETFP